MKHKRGNEIEIEQTLGYSSVTEPVAARISGHSSTPLYSLSSSCCSDGSKDTPLLSVDANILYLVLNCHLVLVRKHGNCLQNVCENHDDCPMGCFCGGDVR